MGQLANQSQEIKVGEQFDLFGHSPKISQAGSLVSREVRLLGELLGQVITEQAGGEILELEEAIRKTLKELREAPNPERHQTLREFIDKLDPKELDHVNKAFSIYFQLVNLAEQREGIRLVTDPDTRGGAANYRESIEGVLERFKKAELSAEKVQELLAQTSIVNVLTAHPTEAKLPAITEKLDRISALLDGAQFNEKGEILLNSRTREALLCEITSLWQTPAARAEKITVLDEVRAGLAYFPRALFAVVPEVQRSLADALKKHYPEADFEFGRIFCFGSWIGGDADGNPLVTPEVAKQTLAMQREVVLQHYVQEVEALRKEITQSTREVAASPELLAALRFDASSGAASPDEVYRVFLAGVGGRLEATLKSVSLGLSDLSEISNSSFGAYRTPFEFMRDLRLIDLSLRDNKGERIANGRLSDLMAQVEVFGFHLMTLDIRQHSEVHGRCVAEILYQRGLAEKYAELPESEKIKALSKALNDSESSFYAALSLDSAQTLNSMKLIRNAQRTLGKEVIENYIISFSQNPSDVLEVLLLAKECGVAKLADGVVTESSLNIVPLFETIEDLQRAPKILDELLKNASFRSQISARGNVMEVMLGYSDSSKDGGYLASNVCLDAAQLELSEMARMHGVQLNFFHGRGGTTSRGGGGPVHDAVLAQREETLSGRIRVTKQGEVISKEYSNVHIASDNLEKLISAVLEVKGRHYLEESKQERPANWDLIVEQMVETSQAKYRELVYSDPKFAQVFSEITPIGELKHLNLGSRPAWRSEGDMEIDKLRAIPWNFAWTQARAMVPAWYGVGTALSEIMRQPDGEDHLKQMYARSPFFRNLIENCEVAFSKADMEILRYYTTLASDPGEAQKVMNKIESEYSLTREAILRLSEQSQLLERDQGTQSKLKLRTPYADALSLIQVRIIKEWRRCDSGSEAWNYWCEQFGKNAAALATAMRNTG